MVIILTLLENVQGAFSLAFVAISFVLGISIMLRYKKYKTKEEFPGEGIYSFPLWEWSLALVFFFGVAWVVLFLPN